MSGPCPQCRGEHLYGAPEGTRPEVLRRGRIAVFLVMNSRDRCRLLAIAAAGWVGGWIWLTRYFQLDDAYIHLRYAEYLRRYGFLTFDGVHKTGGCSSLLYVGLLSVLLGLAKPALASKVLSVASYLSILVAVWVLGRRDRFRNVLWTGLLIVLMSPMALRWLCDGMETSLTVFVATALGGLAYRLAQDPTRSAARYAALVTLGSLTVLLRIELSLLVATASVATWFLAVERQTGTDWQSRSKTLLHTAGRESHLAAGGCAALALTLYLTGRLLPDTAVAKSAGGVQIAQAWHVVRAFAASFSFGLGLVGIWLLSLTVLLRTPALRRRHAASLLMASSVFPVMVAATVVRGQYIHGVRYFLWPLAFTIVWNLCMISVAATSEQSFRDGAGRLDGARNPRWSPACWFCPQPGRWKDARSAESPRMPPAYSWKCATTTWKLCKASWASPSISASFRTSRRERFATWAAW